MTFTIEDCKMGMPAAELERQIMSACEPKNEREWWAHREIERLRRMLQHIAAQTYDAGYSAEDFARHAQDPKFDEGDVI